MNVNLLPFTVLWMILAVIVFGLILYRKWIAKDEDDSLHVMDAESGIVAQQAGMARKLDLIDHWGKMLTAITLVYGVLVGSGYVYHAWSAAEASLR